jgi:hypothetical protein
MIHHTSARPRFNNDYPRIDSLSEEDIQHRFLGGLIKKLGNFLFGHATTRMKNFLKEHGEDKITSLKVCRTPIESAIDTAVNLISSGGYQRGKSASGYDKFFHLYLVVNGAWRLEKNQTVNVIPYKPAPGEEEMGVAGSGTTINEFMNKGVKRLGEDKFWGDYDALDNNCQVWCKAILNANGINNADSFVYQNTEALKKEIGESAHDTVNGITNFAEGVDKLASWISNGRWGLKRGGKPHHIRFG